MKYWFDTEFYEDGETIQLISIGIVSEDGRQYYAETVGSDSLAHRYKWLRENVWPHLLGPGAQKYHHQIAQELIEFMGENPEIWAYYADYDWVALCQIFGTMMDLPKGWPLFCRDVKQLAVSLGDPKLPEQSGDEHHALSDASWAKDAWEFLQK